MNHIFTINYIDFLLTSQHIANSNVLQIIMEQSNDKIINIKLPKKFQNVTKQDLADVLYILGLGNLTKDDDQTLDQYVKNNFTKKIMLNILEKYDTYACLLDYFDNTKKQSHDLIKIVNCYTDLHIYGSEYKTIEYQDGDEDKDEDKDVNEIQDDLLDEIIITVDDPVFILALCRSKLTSGRTKLTSGRIKLLDKLQNNICAKMINPLSWYMDLNILDPMIFMKILGMIKPEDKRQFIDISSIIINKCIKNNDKITFNPDIIKKRLGEFSFNILDEEFMESLDHRYVFFAGGSFLGAIQGFLPGWSDIDLWVCGDDKETILEQTFKLLHSLQDAFYNKGYINLLWSCNKNVITSYCVGYSRNIQIIMVQGQASKNVNEFDFDYLRTYMKNNKIYGSVESIQRLIENKVSEIPIDKLKTFRIVKSLVKGYDFSDNLLQNAMISETVKKYNKYNTCKENKEFGYIDQIQEEINPNTAKSVDSMDSMDSESLMNLLCRTINKYYYPVLSDYQQFKASLVPYHESRAYYMINIMCGHKIVRTNLEDIEKDLNLIVKEKDFSFTTQYTIENKKAYIKMKHIDNINLDNMYLQTNIRVYMSPMHYIPIMYNVNNVMTKFEFTTDKFILNTHPFFRKIRRNDNDNNKTELDLCKIRLKLMKHIENQPEIIKIFNLIEQFDASMKDLFAEPFRLKNIDTGKEFTLRRPKYCDLIKHPNYHVPIDDDSVDDEPIDDGAINIMDHTYIVFNMMFDKEENITTQIYHKGIKKHIAALKDIENIIKYTSNVVLHGRFERIYFRKDMYHHVYPKLFLTRIDVM